MVRREKLLLPTAQKRRDLFDASRKANALFNLTKSLYGGLVSVKIFKKLQVIPVNFTSMLSSSINTAEENKRQIRSFK